jgi:hypothetical protein
VANSVNQHFVPQFYFKLFTSGDRRIHLLHKKSERILLNASIKGQCARHRFYGPAEIEALFSPLESQHSAVLRHIRDLAWSPSPPPLESEHLARLWEALVFQRARTVLEGEKTTPANEEHQGAVALSITTALESVLLISDLDVHVLRNLTDLPFVFGDAPVVFCNTYYRNVTHRGVLGYQTPGLQIFYPIDSRTLLMLLDDEVYGGRCREPFIVDLDQRCDVSQLNALQLHHSLDAIYFADARDQEYVGELWNAHKQAVVQPKLQLRNRKGWFNQGNECDDDLYHWFEPHLNFRLALSFIECSPIQPAQYAFRRRSPTLFHEVMQREAVTAPRRVARRPAH